MQKQNLWSPKISLKIKNQDIFYCKNCYVDIWKIHPELKGGGWKCGFFFYHLNYRNCVHVRKTFVKTSWSCCIL